MEMTIADGIGLAGAATIVVCYFLLQVGQLDPRSIAYSAANGLGAAAILFSLAFEFNLSAFVIELFWLAVSVMGLVRATRLRRAPAPRARED